MTMTTTRPSRDEPNTLGSKINLAASMNSKLTCAFEIAILATALAIQGYARHAHADSETFSKHVVVAGEGHAADAGREMLNRGGNAIDAAIATAFALAVTLPEAGNLGGGGFIVAYLNDRREVVTVDFRETGSQIVDPDDVSGRRRKTAAPIPHRCLVGRRAGHRPRPRTGARAVRQDSLGRARAARRTAGPRGLPDLGRASPLAQSSARTAKPGARPASQRATISADSAISRNRSLRSASPTTPPGSRATGLIQRDLAACLDRIAEKAPMNSTPAAPPSSSPDT